MSRVTENYRRRLYPDRAVAEIFRDAVEERVPFPAAAAGEEAPGSGRAVAVAIVEFLQDPQRMTTTFNLQLEAPSVTVISARRIA